LPFGITPAKPASVLDKYRSRPHFLDMTPNTKPILFLLRAGFADPKHRPGGLFCPECATIAGLLYYYPQLVESLDIRLVDVPRPRPEVVAFVGEENQSCPVLVLPQGDLPAGVPVANGRAFVSGPEPIVNFLAERYGTARSH
jgi:hypothetical protein